MSTYWHTPHCASVMPYKNGRGARGYRSCSPFAIIVSYFVVTSAVGVRWSSFIIPLYSRVLLGAFLFEDFDDPAEVYLDAVPHGKRQKTAEPFFSAEVAQFVLDDWPVLKTIPRQKLMWLARVA